MIKALQEHLLAMDTTLRDYGEDSFAQMVSVNDSIRAMEARIATSAEHVNSARLESSTTDAAVRLRMEELRT